MASNEIAAVLRPRIGQAAARKRGPRRVLPLPPLGRGQSRGPSNEVYEKEPPVEELTATAALTPSRARR
eukprot:91769-Alexandrium_andersonii.AAC.1